LIDTVDCDKLTLSNVGVLDHSGLWEPSSSGSG
jgi:hypothetical protein